MELDSPLTMIGLIATVLSMLFALAALWKSHHKKVPRPGPGASSPSTTPPLPAVRQVAQQRLADKPLAAATPPGQPLVVFKQAGSDGGDTAVTSPYADNAYIWE